MSHEDSEEQQGRKPKQIVGLCNRKNKKHHRFETMTPPRKHFASKSDNDEDYVDEDNDTNEEDSDVEGLRHIDDAKEDGPPLAAAVSTMHGTIRGISKHKAKIKQKRHAVGRIHGQVKNEIFPQVKFIPNDNMFKTAFGLVIQRGKVPPHAQHEFAAVYKSTFMEALNTKRNNCEQAAGKVFLKTLETNSTLNADNFLPSRNFQR